MDPLRSRGAACGLTAPASLVCILNCVKGVHHGEEEQAKPPGGQRLMEEGWAAFAKCIIEICRCLAAICSLLAEQHPKRREDFLEFHDRFEALSRVFSRSLQEAFPQIGFQEDEEAN